MTWGFKTRFNATYIEIVGWWWMLANVADALATHHAVIDHGATELNPLMAPLIGTPWFFLVKTIVPGAILYFVLPRQRWHWALVVGTIIMLAAATWNTIGVL